MSTSQTFDWIIRNGWVVDGSGNPGFQADVGIKSDLITEIGDLQAANADRVIDATNQVVCPGFIDPHSHVDLWLLEHPLNEAKLCQGVTTEILGQDGISSYPASNHTQQIIDEMWSGINGKHPDNISFTSVREFAQHLNGKTSVNTAFLAPHLTIRIEVMGLAERLAAPNELIDMRQIVDRAMADGCAGLSTGLTYWPETYADLDELIEVCRPLKNWGGIYVTHLRSYRDQIIPAIIEAISIGKAAGIPVHISHLNHRADLVLPVLDNASLAGLDITFDLYPYLAGATFLSQILPTWVFSRSIPNTLTHLVDPHFRNRIIRELEPIAYEWEGNLISSAVDSPYKQYEGRTLKQIAGEMGCSLLDVILDIIVQTRMSATVLIFHSHRTEEDICQMLQHPRQMFCTDSILVGGHPHPRAYGTFPRVLGRYVRQQHVLSLETAIQKMTSFPAARFNLFDRGLLKAGLAADIVVFDPERIIDTATFDRPKQTPLGIQYVWVNGVLVLNSNGPTGATPGKTLNFNRIRMRID